MHQTRVLLNNAQEQLKDTSDTPRLDAEILLAHTLNISRSSLLALESIVELPEQFSALVARRSRSEPIAYMLGEWEFFSLPFFVEAPVLVPRPETEHLVESVLQFCGEPESILDIGTGTGCVVITLLTQLPEAHGYATDLKDHNLELARKNATRHQVVDRLRFEPGDLFEPFDSSSKTFDVICSNPPYVALRDQDTLDPTVKNFEDGTALFSGDDGLDLIRRLIEEAPKHLTAEGWLAFEFGIRQDSVIEQLLSGRGYRDIRIVPDLAGIPRIALGRTPA